MFERDSVLSVRPVPTHGLGAFASVGACGRVLWACSPLLSTSARAGAGVMARRPAPIQPAINHESLPCLIYLP